jgi:hypothetical protein
MSALVMPWTGLIPVFHVRIGCCGACGDMVDAVLRDSFKGRPPVAECDSPRHAGLIIVSGMWNEGLAGPALDVISQAPEAAGCSPRDSGAWSPSRCTSRLTPKSLAARSRWKLSARG